MLTLAPVGCKPAVNAVKNVSKDKEMQRKLGEAVVVGGAGGVAKEVGSDGYKWLKGDGLKKEKGD